MPDSSITKTNTKEEIYNFWMDPQSDAVCGLSSMMTWSFPDSTTLQATLSVLGTSPAWPIVLPPPSAVSQKSIDIAFTSMPGATKDSTPLPTHSNDVKVSLNYLVDNLVNTFCLMMLQTQVATLLSTPSLLATDPLLKVITSACTAAATAFNPSTPNTSATCTLPNLITTATRLATASINSNPSNAAFGVVSAQTLCTLLPLMMNPYWTLSYYAAYVRGHFVDVSSNATTLNLYNSRVAFIGITKAVDLWLSFLTSLRFSDDHTTIISLVTWIKDEVSTTLTAEDTPMMDTQNNRAVSYGITAFQELDLLQRTNDQFKRRRVSVGALSENLTASRRSTGGALSVLLVWVTASVVSIVIAIYLLQTSDHSLLRMLILATLILVTVDVLARGVVGVGQGEAANVLGMRLP